MYKRKGAICLFKCMLKKCAVVVLDADIVGQCLFLQYLINFQLVIYISKKHKKNDLQMFDMEIIKIKNKKSNGI